MDFLSLFFTLAVVFGFHGCNSGLVCFNCDDCVNEIRRSENCRGYHDKCISYVDDNKVVKRCGSQKECERVGNPSPDHTQYMANHHDFVDGLMEFDVATLDTTTFRQNDSYCCNTDLCDSQSPRLVKREEYASDITDSMRTSTKLRNHEGFYGETTDGDITSTGNPLEESIEYSYGTTTRRPHHHKVGYSAPKLRTKVNGYTTVSVDSEQFAEKRSKKRSPEDENTVEDSKPKEHENLVTVGSTETTFSAHNSSVRSTGSTAVFDSTTVTKPFDSEGNSEPITNGIRSLVFCESILMPIVILYIFW